MSSSTLDLRLFGLDLTSLAQDFRRAWQGMHNWRVVSWLEPRVQVLLHQADGQQLAWRSGASRQLFVPDFSVKGEPSPGTAPFWAIEVPEELLLRRSLILPPLAREQIEQSVAVEVRSSTPFSNTDLLWGFVAIEQAKEGNKAISVDVVQASKSQVQEYLRSVSASSSQLSPPEAWVRRVAGDAAFIFPGFGEARRIHHVNRRRMIAWLLVDATMALLILVALTPTLQLRARAMEAVQSYDALALQVAPLVKEREKLTKAAEQTNALKSLVAQTVDPLRVLNIVTATLPDDTVLQRLDIEQRTVRISGQSANAAAIMQKLGAMPQIASVKAPVAATRPLGAPKESFQIEFVWVPEAATSADLGRPVVNLADPAPPAFELGGAPSAPTTSGAKTLEGSR